MLAKQKKHKNALKVVIPLKQIVNIYYTQNFSNKYSHSYRASSYYQSFIYAPTDALVSCLKEQY